MKRYRVRMGGGVMNLTEADIAVLFRSGGITKVTMCAEIGKDWWQTIDEMFPLLKHEVRSSVLYDQYPSTTDRSKTSAMKAGWICLCIGAAVSWFFPLGYIFFSVALVLAVVAMATHQVSRGLILFLSSFLAMGVSMLISFLLAIGLFAAVAGNAISKAEEAVKTRDAKINQQTNAFNQAIRNTTQAFPTQQSPTATADDLKRQINQMNQTIRKTEPTFQQVPTQRITNPFPNPGSASIVPVRPAIDTSVEAQLRRIEQQRRARENYKTQHDSLHRSIDFWEKNARNSQKGSREFCEKQVDALRKQLQELNSKNIGM